MRRIMATSDFGFRIQEIEYSYMVLELDFNPKSEIRNPKSSHPPRGGTGCALFALGSYLPLAASAETLVSTSADALTSYQPPSAKSISARPFQLTVTTRPTRPSNRFNSGRTGLMVTYWSVHSDFRASIWSGLGVIMSRSSWVP